MTTKHAPATPLTTALLHECAERGNRSAAFSRMLDHAARMETDRAKLVEALRALAKDADQQCKDEGWPKLDTSDDARALLRSLGEAE